MQFTSCNSSTIVNNVNWQWPLVKKDDFNFPIMNFSFIYSNNKAVPAYEYTVYLSVDMIYSRALDSYHHFIDRGLPLTKKLPKHVFLVVKAKVSRAPPWLGQPLRNICHKWPCIYMYIPFVVITILSIPHPWFATELECKNNINGSSRRAETAYFSGAWNSAPF